MIIPSVYFPNIQWFEKLRQGALIEENENFIKQTYRNRCEVVSDKGRQNLVVPIKWKHNQKMPFREVEIDNYSSPQWAHNHLKALKSYYRMAPFFDHFFVEVEALLRKEYRYLWELNRATTTFLLDSFRLELNPQYTTVYEPRERYDMRDIISPKGERWREDKDFYLKEYYQVFKSRVPFENNVSMLDYLFCEGRL